ncbi:MAG: DAK2 domain-containing protein [Firmicutes bacterium]|nr:DAK2 domain-containing protein [Bacillota bacterium]
MIDTKTVNGKEFEKALAGGITYLKAGEETLNNLNVFPVPDGDTGTNMSSTANGALHAASCDSIGEYTAAAASGMMRESRGNSGVILSLFFRGMAKALNGLEKADPQAMLDALRAGYKGALSAVAKPMEGTILTVMRECCSEDIDAPDISHLLGVVLARAEDVLAKTPDMLPALKRAKVVDSGGQGFVFMLKGMKLALDGEELPAMTDSQAAAAKPEDEGAEAPFEEMAEEEITFGFCTEALLDRNSDTSDEGIAEFRRMISDMGDSMVFVSDEELIKLHIHTNEPMTVLAAATALGQIVKIKIENMRVQHTGFIQKGAEEKEERSLIEKGGEVLEGILSTVAEKLPKKKDRNAEPVINKPYGIAAVCEGDGMMDAFRQAGALAVIDGGKSMNPSINDIIDGIRECEAETVFVLPNNKNTVMAAEQAAQLCPESDVRVIKSVTMIEGISAAMGFNPVRGTDENEEMMNQAAASVKTLSFSRAAKDAEMEDVTVKKKQYIGILGGKILSSEDTLEQSVAALLEKAGEADFYTVYYGHGVKENDAAQIAALIEDTVEDAEVVLVNGGQKLYPYIISAE